MVCFKKLLNQFIWLSLKTTDILLKTEDVLLKTKDGPSVNRKLLTHILTNVPTHTQASNLDDYNKLSHRLSLKTHTIQ